MHDLPLDKNTKMKFMPDCTEVTTRLWSPLHEIVLSTREKIGLKAHLLMCPSCRRYQKTFEWVLNTLEQAPDTPALSVKYKMPTTTKESLKITIAKEKD